MNQASAAQHTIFMLPCGGVSNVGQLAVLAVQELVLEGKGKWVSCCDSMELQILNGRKADSPPFIVVDGCEQQCARKRLEAITGDLEFHLSLADLGIEKTEFSEIIADELQLVKDAIIAESTRLSKQPPKMMGACCCR